MLVGEERGSFQNRAHRPPTSMSPRELLRQQTHSHQHQGQHRLQNQRVLGGRGSDGEGTKEFVHPRQADLRPPGAAGGAWGPRHASEAPWAQRSAGGTRRPACHPPLPTLKPLCSGDASTSAPLGGSQEETGISNNALESLDSGCPGDGLRPLLPVWRLALAPSSSQTWTGKA